MISRTLARDSSLMGLVSELATPQLRLVQVKIFIFFPHTLQVVSLVPGLFIDVGENQSFLDTLTISYIYSELDTERRLMGNVSSLCVHVCHGTCVLESGPERSVFVSLHLCVSCCLSGWRSCSACPLRLNARDILPAAVAGVKGSVREAQAMDCQLPRSEHTHDGLQRRLQPACYSGEQIALTLECTTKAKLVQSEQGGVHLLKCLCCSQPRIVRTQMHSITTCRCWGSCITW